MRSARHQQQEKSAENLAIKELKTVFTMIRKPVKPTDPSEYVDSPSTPSVKSSRSLSPTEKHAKKTAAVKSYLSSIMLPLSIALVAVLVSPFAYVLVTRLGLGSPFPSQPAFA